MWLVARTPVFCLCVGRTHGARDSVRSCMSGVVCGCRNTAHIELYGIVVVGAVVVGMRVLAGVGQRWSAHCMCGGIWFGLGFGVLWGSTLPSRDHSSQNSKREKDAGYSAWTLSVWRQEEAHRLIVVAHAEA